MDTDDALEVLALANVAVRHGGGPRRVAAELRARGVDVLRHRFDHLASTARQEILEESSRLAAEGASAVLLTDRDYPQGLAQLRLAPPALFVIGDAGLAGSRSIGVCGSRSASKDGLRAARLCGELAARTGYTVVSGYARGVDTEAHRSALAAGGPTVLVLAEGLAHFRVKRSLQMQGWDGARAAVVSQFAPRQRWTAGAAMTRNAVIVGLSQALVVVEAGESGGTLNAGKQALAIGRPVLALQFSGGTPKGNQHLIDSGAIPISSAQELRYHFQTLTDDPLGGPLRLL